MPGPCLSPPARPQGPHPSPQRLDARPTLPSVPHGSELSKGLLIPAPCHPVTPSLWADNLRIQDSHPRCTKVGAALQLFGPTGHAG